MIDPAVLLNDLQRLLSELEKDIRERVTETSELEESLREQYVQAREADRTAQAYEEWREEPITQAAVAWILGPVFVRFMEDNGLVEPPRIAGAGERLRLARDHHTVYFQKHPAETDREYLLDVFREVAQLPAAKELFDERHNPLWSLAPSGDGAKRLLDLFQRIDPESGALVHGFTDPEWGSRFLGDLYQDLSESARKKYALLQTPEFVEEFILERTLGPAIEEFGYREVRLIDPTCGSGHFLLGAFRTLLELRLRHEPGTNVRELVQQSLDAVCGVDLNPFAVAIARFRLLLVALKACGISRLKDAPGFHFNLAVGDSLLHGPRFSRGAKALDVPVAQMALDGRDSLGHCYATEDRAALRQILGQQYHGVVGNPPYITVKDKALNRAYRAKYGSCHRQYSLAVPFMERFFELALAPQPNSAGKGTSKDVRPTSHSGFAGMITANSFMKREFGKKLIEKYIPNWDLTHVIDISGAYIPGHGTPTVILFGRNRLPVGDSVRAVMGIRGEPTTPEEPAKGLVWSAILRQLDQRGSQSDYVSVSDVGRATFHQHPWSLGGGGATELKELLEQNTQSRLAELVEEIGSGAVTREDEVYLLSTSAALRQGVPEDQIRPLVAGEEIRDWAIHEPTGALWPYDPTTLVSDAAPGLLRFLWPYRCQLSQRVAYGKTQIERGLQWFEYSMFFRERFRTPLSIAFAFVATHNHFVLDSGGKVFNRSAPVIKLLKDATEDEHLALLGLLNSSTGCFWMKQVFYDKGVGGIGGGIGDEKWEPRFEFDASKMAAFPVPPAVTAIALAASLHQTAAISAQLLPAALCQHAPPSAESLAAAREQWTEALQRMTALQEELDWYAYRAYSLVEDDLAAPLPALPGVRLGERAFEIVLARGLASGKSGTAWFERHGSTPVTEIPTHWPEEYRRLVERRITLIETNPNIRLIEQPEYKRRWNTEPWDTQQERGLRSWFLDRLESPAYWPSQELQSCARLADRAHADSEFMQVGELYRGRADFDVTALVTDLVESESVPFLPVLRYKESGLRKRALWEKTWQAQRREDAIDARIPLPEDEVDRTQAEAERAKAKKAEVGEIPVPPKYKSSDFRNGTCWRLRGKLDVPKERFLSYPGCGRDADPTLLVGWAGWDHLQQAQALASHHVSMKNTEGWPTERLTPLLAGLLELLPWLEQCHNELNPSVGMGMGEYFRRFLEEEARSLDLTFEAIQAWTPDETRRTRRRRRKATQGD